MSHILMCVCICIHIHIYMYMHTQIIAQAECLHVSHMNESYHMYECGMSHTLMCKYTRANTEYRAHYVPSCHSTHVYVYE